LFCQEIGEETEISERITEKKVNCHKAGEHHFEGQKPVDALANCFTPSMISLAI